MTKESSDSSKRRAHGFDKLGKAARNKIAPTRGANDPGSRTQGRKSQDRPRPTQEGKRSKG